MKTNLEKRMAKWEDLRAQRPSIISAAKSIEFTYIKGGIILAFRFDGGAALIGNVQELNCALEILGYKGIRVTRNLANPHHPQFVADIDAPASAVEFWPKSLHRFKFERENK